MSQFTKKAIINSFIKLLNEHPMDQITVKDIVQDCEINRKTFYYYFKDIYALPEDIFYTVADTYLQKKEGSGFLEDKIVQLYELAYQNKKAILHVYHSISLEQLDAYISNITGKMMSVYIKNLLLTESCDSRDIESLTSFYLNAVVGITLDWIRHGMKEDPEKTIRKIGKLIKEPVQFTRNIENQAQL